MATRREEPKFTLRLIVDEEKNKVVLAEACRDFVDVLFSFLKLPMGSIIRILENRRKSEPATVGCFNNLYRSVLDMGNDSFVRFVYKQLLLYPRSVWDVQCKRLKLNIKAGNCDLYNNLSTSRCCCKLGNEDQVARWSQSNVNGVFVSGWGSFILTDDLKVAVKPTELVLNKLKSLGYADVNKLGERLLEIGLEEVCCFFLQAVSSLLYSFALTLRLNHGPGTHSARMFILLKYSFDGNFLKQARSGPQGVTKILKSLRPCLEKKEDEAEPEKIVTLKAVVRKQDMKLLFVECGEEFVELLFSFLVVPLESVWQISGSCILGCVGNLCRSFKDLTPIEGSNFVCALPCYYRFRMQLPGIITQQAPNLYPSRLGFLKEETKFTVLDDLTITSMNSISPVCLLKKFQSHADDLEVQVISISNTEALNLLRASLVTTSALSTAFRNLFAKKLKEETDF